MSFAVIALLVIGIGAIIAVTTLNRQKRGRQPEVGYGLPTFAILSRFEKYLSEEFGGGGESKYVAPWHDRILEFLIDKDALVVFTDLRPHEIGVAQVICDAGLRFVSREIGLHHVRVLGQGCQELYSVTYIVRRGDTIYP